MNYYLEERTAKFGENIIAFCRILDSNAINKPIINQLIRSSTSIGANYMEANNASSRNDFRNKIFICKKETQETKHWLRMLAQAVPEKKKQIILFLKESHELILIFQKIINSLKNKKNEN